MIKKADAEILMISAGIFFRIIKHAKIAAQSARIIPKAEPVKTERGLFEYFADSANAVISDLSPNSARKKVRARAVKEVRFGLIFSGFYSSSKRVVTPKTKNKMAAKISTTVSRTGI
jgi:hypothetical protein